MSETGIPTSDYDLVDEKQLLGPRGVRQVLVNRQRLKLQSYFWPAPDAKAVLVFVHGHGAHMLFEVLAANGLGKATKYAGGWAEGFNAAGISVCGIDNQGCGRSEALRGLRFYVESFDDYVEDVLQLARSLSTATVPGFKDLPIFICGLSLGGCIVYNAMLRERRKPACLVTQPGLFRGAILLAPMLSLEKVSRRGLNPYIRPISRLLNWLWPTGQLVATDRNPLYPDIQAEWDEDPLTLHCNTFVRNANEYLRVTEEAMRSLEKADFPFLAIQSENDTMCDCEGVKQLYLRSTSKDKTLRLVNHMWHVLMREPGEEKILAEIIDWILARAN